MYLELHINTYVSVSIYMSQGPIFLDQAVHRVPNELIYICYIYIYIYLIGYIRYIFKKNTICVFN